MDKQNRDSTGLLSAKTPATLQDPIVSDSVDAGAAAADPGPHRNPDWKPGAFMEAHDMKPMNSTTQSSSAEETNQGGTSSSPLSPGLTAGVCLPPHPPFVVLPPATSAVPQ